MGQFATLMLGTSVVFWDRFMDASYNSVSIHCRQSTDKTTRHWWKAWAIESPWRTHRFIGTGFVISYHNFIIKISCWSCAALGLLVFASLEYCHNLYLCPEYINLRLRVFPLHTGFMIFDLIGDCDFEGIMGVVISRWCGEVVLRWLNRLSGVS